MSEPDPLTDSSNFALGRLRALLDDSSFDAGQRLPPERELAARIGIGRRALRRALEVLEAEGRIWRHQGKGTFLGSRAGLWFGVRARVKWLKLLMAAILLWVSVMYLFKAL